MKYIDLHCDTLSKAYSHNVDDIGNWPLAMVDIDRLYKADCIAQFFAIYMPDERNEDFNDDEYILMLVELLKCNIKRYEDKIAYARNYGMLVENDRKQKISAFLTIEDGRSVNGCFEKIKKYYDLGVRLITLTWNSPNCFGYPNSFDKNIMEKGLTSFGMDAVSYMNDLGILVDVSHLSDGGFYDVCEVSKKPFVASHSNCRELSPHPRNLTDDMIRLLASKGGVIGVNIVPGFLSSDIGSRESFIDDVARHVVHMISKGGIECVCIGTDFDGTGGSIELNEPAKVQLLFERLKKMGIREDALGKIAYRNATRVIKDCIG
ncbi:MAG TPA: dipeptidase [Clostridia bacterium]|nr:dipeptidase [Clostridia bacterium]HPZ51783.1 dipeptidase [Clostridia bacterium]